MFLKYRNVHALDPNHPVTILLLPHRNVACIILEFESCKNRWLVGFIQYEYMFSHYTNICGVECNLIKINKQFEQIDNIELRNNRCCTFDFIEYKRRKRLLEVVMCFDKLADYCTISPYNNNYLKRCNSLCESEACTINASCWHTRWLPKDNPFYDGYLTHPGFQFFKPFCVSNSP